MQAVALLSLLIKEVNSPTPAGGSYYHLGAVKSAVPQDRKSSLSPRSCPLNTSLGKGKNRDIASPRSHYWPPHSTGDMAGTEECVAYRLIPTVLIYHRELFPYGEENSGAHPFLLERFCMDFVGDPILYLLNFVYATGLDYSGSGPNGKFLGFRDDEWN